MEIRELDSSTVEALAELFVEMWPDTSLESELPFCKDLLRANDATAFLTFEEEAIGFIYLSTRNDFVEGAELNKPVGYVEGIYVREAHRGEGIAGALLDAGIAWAKEMGYTQLASDTEVENSVSESFHLNQGFREANRVICFIREI